MLTANNYISFISIVAGSVKLIIIYGSVKLIAYKKMKMKMTMMKTGRKKKKKKMMKTSEIFII